MPNVLLTTGCNLACEYCFAQEKMQGKSRYMTLEDACKVIQFLKRSDCEVFRVMGGEPTLHPQFEAIVREALREGMRVDVLSNATWSRNCREFFDRVSPDSLLFLLNIDHPDNYSPKLWARIEANLTALSGRKGVTLSFNIFEKTPRCDYIFDLTARYGIHNIRMSFSLPVWNGQNRYLPLEDYQEMAPFILDFVRKAEEQSVTAQLDNAVPFCVFSEEQMGRLLLKGVLDLKRNARCEPIVDIGPDMAVWFCFCLSSIYNRHLDEFQNVAEIQDYYRRVMSVYQDRIFPMEECYDCEYRTRWGCQGGCITHSIIKDGGSHLKEESSEANEPVIPSNAALALAQDVTIRHYELPQEIFLLSQASTGLQIEVGGFFQPLWPLLDGQKTLSEVISAFLGEESAETASDLFFREVMAESLSDLIVGLAGQGLIAYRPTGVNV